MALIIDTREKENRHITDYFDWLGTPYKVQKLDVGDYSMGGKTAVERKGSLLEWANNLGKQHARFKRELERAKEAGIRLVILLECKRGETLENWSSPRTEMKPQTMLKIMDAWTQKYDVEYRYCYKAMAGEEILKILKENV